MPLLNDVLHLLVIVAGLAIGAWSLFAFRKTMPVGRFALFGMASAGALFGCAALSGEIGLLPPVAWFAIVMSVMLCTPITAQRLLQPRVAER